MPDDIVTQRLRTLAEAPDEDYEPSGDTLELEKMDLMATNEFRQLLDPADELTAAIEADLDESE